jgi:hypothetical protein
MSHISVYLLKLRETSTMQPECRKSRPFQGPTNRYAKIHTSSNTTIILLIIIDVNTLNSSIRIVFIDKYTFGNYSAGGRRK